MRTLDHRRTSFLALYTHDVPGLMAVLRDTRSVIGGSACLAVLNRVGDWVPNDLDVFCPRDGYETCCVYLIDRLHGQVITHLDEDDLNSERPGDCPEGVCDRRVIRTKFGLFDVMCSSTLTATEPIAHAFSSHLMNFISADSICVAYPWSFNNRCGTTRARDTGHSCREITDSYVRRDYYFPPRLRDQLRGRQVGGCPRNGYCARQLRYFGDKHCLTVTFPQYGKVVILCNPTAMPSMPEAEEETAWSSAWVFGGKGCGEECIGNFDSYVNAVVCYSGPSLL